MPCVSNILQTSITLYAHLLSFNKAYKVFTFNIEINQCVKATFYYHGMRKDLSKLMSKL